MKKFLPIIIFIVGALVLVGVYLFVIKGKKETGEATNEETALIEVSLEKRPVTSLTPSNDGHWLKLEIKKIVIRAASLDYELLYKLPDGRIQGVPGTIKLEGQETLEIDLLLGSESSGKFRYDEGVEQGTLALRFRDEKGKLIAKFSTDFHLQNDGSPNVLSSVDNEFSYKLDKVFKRQSAFYVTMDTIGIPGEFDGDIVVGPYGIFSSVAGPAPGIAEMNSEFVYYWDASSWSKLENNESSDIGIFISATQ